MARQLAPETDQPAVDLGSLTPAEWRAAMGYFPSGVTVVTSWRDGVPVGSTINAFCSVSLDPPMLMICLDKANPILGAVQDSGVFGVNILGEDGGPLALHFARLPETDRFAELGWRSVSAGAPQLDDAPVFVDCRVEDAHLAGDHYIFVARGVRTDHTSAAAPLLYHRGRFSKLGPAG